MCRVRILHVASFMVSILFSGAVYDEMYRPQLRYSPPKGWLSDACGLFYKDGIFHLFHQCRTNDTAHGPMLWGHVISTDLLYWKTLDTALFPPAGMAHYSGGAILDYNNASGLQTDSNLPALLLYSCTSNKTTLEQSIWMAYSNDGPHYIKFEHYEKRPLIPNSGVRKYFRDPTVFKYGDHFVMIVGVKDRHRFYHSRNLLDWECVSEFGEFDGAHGGSWECPSLFTMNVTIDGKQIEKYILLTTRTSFNQPIQQYFIGSFDGKQFKNENPPETTLWLEYGPDGFAGEVWYERPDGRRFFINWMSRWEYAISLRFNAWNGQFGLTRELKLINVHVRGVGDQLRLTSYPIREVESLRTNHVGKKNVKITNEFHLDIANGVPKKHLVDIEMTMDLAKFKAADTFVIVFSGQNHQLKISFKDNEFTLDRLSCGRIDIPNAYYALREGLRIFGQLWTGYRLIDSPIMKLRIIIDANCIEMFIDDGLSAMSCLFYSEEDIASKMTIQLHSHSNNSQINLAALNVYEMKSIWHNGESAKPITV